MNRSILILKGDSDKYDKPFESWGYITDNIDLLEDVDLVVFTGGGDVNPYLYGDNKLLSTDDPSTDRDHLEQAVYTRALMLGIPMVGICRGAQFLCVMNGGKLIQDVTGHRNCVHTINTRKGGKPLEVKGDHHQMMWPSGEFNVLGYSIGISDIYDTGTALDNVKFIEEFTDSNGDVREPEVVHWPLTRCLAIQFHPEWHRSIEPASFYFQSLLDKLMM